MTIERTPVSSSNIQSVGYDADGKLLAVEFKDGSIYHYHDVPKDAYDDLMAAKSLGGHLHKNIKGIYKHAKEDP